MKFQLVTEGKYWNLTFFDVNAFSIPYASSYFSGHIFHKINSLSICGSINNSFMFHAD